MIVKEAISKFDVEILEHLDREVDVPLITRAGCQGDVSVLRVTTGPARTVVPAVGVAVVRGENGGNTHSLHGDGPILFDAAADSRGLALGTLTVPVGSEAVLAHPEHGFMGIAAGTYTVGRQREYAGEWRAVAD